MLNPDAARVLKANHPQQQPADHTGSGTPPQLRGSSSSSSRKLLGSWSSSSSNTFNHANAATLLAEDATDQAINEAADGDISTAWAAREGVVTGHLATLANQGDHFALDELELAGGKRRLSDSSSSSSSGSSDWRAKAAGAVQRSSDAIAQDADEMATADDTDMDDKRRL